MDFIRRLRTNIRTSKSGWRHLLPHPIFLIAFIILAVTVVWQVGIITEFISAGLKVEPAKTTPSGQAQNSAQQSVTPGPKEEPKTFWQKIGEGVNIFSASEKKGEQDLEAKPGSNNLQFSFSDLFSGKGWKNESRSSVYQDFFTTSISAPPAYTWQKIPVSPPNDGSEIVAARSNGRRIILLTSAGNIYSFDSSERLYAQLGLLSPPAGANMGFLDFDAEAGRWIAALTGGAATRFAVLQEENGQFKKLAEFTRSAPSDAGVADAGLACRNGNCLWLHGSEFLTFKDDSRPNPKKEETLSNWFKDKNVSSVSMVKIPEGWLLAKVRLGTEVKYGVDIYLWDGELSQVGEEVFSSNYPGRMRFGYDAAGKKLFGIYAAYIGQVFEFNVPDKFTLVNPKNYSRSFNARVLGGIAAGSIESYPEIFAQDGSWWIGSTPDSPAPRFIKISPAGGAISLTQELLPGARRIFLLPGFETHVIYAVLIKDGIPEAYRFNDRGYEQKEKYVWESVQLNSGSLPIRFGRITNVSGEGDIEYFLSNNGGASWSEAAVGKFIKFSSDTSDFRWRAELFPSASQYSSPWLNLVTVEYYQ